VEELVKPADLQDAPLSRLGLDLSSPSSASSCRCPTSVMFITCRTR
jgi:hypothetical protein